LPGRKTGTGAAIGAYHRCRDLIDGRVVMKLGEAIHGGSPLVDEFGLARLELCPGFIDLMMVGTVLAGGVGSCGSFEGGESAASFCATPRSCSSDCPSRKSSTITRAERSCWLAKVRRAAASFCS